MTDRRHTRYRAPLASGVRRNGLVRFTVSSPPEVFERIRRLAVDRNQPISEVATDLLRHALESPK